MQIKQRVHLPIIHVIKKKFGKHSYTDSLSPKINPRIITCKISHESSVPRFPGNKFA